MTLFTFVVECYTNVGTKKIYADSNDNRALDLAIAEGKNRTEISELATNNNGNGTGIIDNNSMRNIALYLSNFYQPFVTTLTDGADIGVSDKTADDKAAKDKNENLSQFSTDSINALTKYVGVDEEVAQILVKNILKQSLATCQHLYVKRSIVETIFKVNADLKTETNVGNTLKGKVAFSGFSRSWNAYNDKWWKTKADLFDHIDGNYATTIAWKIDGDKKYYKKAYKNKDGKTVKDYIDKLYNDGGKVTVDGTQYVELTYFVYLTLLSYSANHAAPAQGDTVSKAIYNIYWYDKDTSTMTKCFDTGGTCTQAFLMATNELDTEHGVSTSISSLTLDMYEQALKNTDALDGMNAEIVRKALAFFQPMYINWVGDIVVNDGTQSFVVVPGCLNPYTLVKISDGATDYLNGISVKALTYMENGLISKASKNKARGIVSASLQYSESAVTDSTTTESAKKIATSFISELENIAVKTPIKTSDGKESDTKYSQLTDDEKVSMLSTCMRTYYVSIQGHDKGGKKRHIEYPFIYCFEDNDWLGSQDITDKDSDLYIKTSSKTYKSIGNAKEVQGYISGVTSSDNSNSKHYLLFWTYAGFYNYLTKCGLSLKKSAWTDFSNDTVNGADGEFYPDVITDLQEPKIKKVINSDYSQTNLTGATDRYDVATHAHLPGCGTKAYRNFTGKGVSDDNNYINGDKALFTKNGWVTCYGSDDSDPMNFDGKKVGKQAGDAMYEVMSNYGTVAYKYNTGKNYITFPALVYSTFTCSTTFLSGWSARIAAGFCPVNNDTYKDSYAYARLYGTAHNPIENLTGYKMHTDLIYFPDYSVDVSDMNSAIATANIFDTEDKIKASSVSDMSQYTSISNGYGQTLKLSSTSQELFKNIFMTYAFAEFNYEDAPTEFDEEKHKVDLKFNGDIFPEGTGNMDFTYIEDTTGKEIESFVYYLLHPTKGIAYVATWFRNKVSGILLYLHESIVGSSNSNYTTGMTRYLGTSSYTTMPKLTDIKLLANILSIYKNLMIYLILAMLLVIFCFVIVGELTIQRGLLGLLCFAVLAFLPPYMINGAANISNLTADQIFSDKFEYWAISQLETYMDIINTSEGDAVITDNSLELATQVSLASAATSVGGQSNTGYSGTMLKWMSPKKYASSLVNKALQTTSANDSNATFLKSVLETTANTSGTGQQFVHDSDNALYLYRDYVDIYRYASNSYNIDSYAGGFLTQNKSALITSYTNNNATQSKKEHGVYNVWHSKTNGDTQSIPFSKLTHLKYTSGLAVSDFIAANYEYGLDDVGTSTVESNKKNLSLGGNVNNNFTTTLDTAKSNFAVLHGFLYNVFGDTLNTDEGVNYFSYTNTRASTLLLSYAASIAQTQNALDKLTDDLNTGKVNLIYKKFVQNGEYCYGMPHNSYDIDIKSYNNLDDLWTGTSGEKDDDKKDSDDTSTNVDTTQPSANLAKKNYKQLSDFYYDLYTESPFFYFNYNIRDQIVNDVDSGYSFSQTDRTASKNGVANLWLSNNQDYFYNFSANAGDGYGELRDFMNFHDFFYYIIPSLQPGIDLLYKWDKAYGYYLYDDCSLKFTNAGTIKYDGKETKTNDEGLKDILTEEDWNNLTQEDRYKLWHNYNVLLINQSYCSWLDTMEDCSYSKPEKISIMGNSYTVQNPLDPTSYFSVALNDCTINGVKHKKGEVVSGRYMVFSRSEMKYYGLKWSDLTKVEQKIITVQDKVYKEALNLMNYSVVSDENLIQAFAMLETFIFNKEFSQKNMVTGKGYIMYPQGYELKAFTYDAYLRLILAESSENIDLEVEGTNTNNDDNEEVTSIYKRIMDNTSIFFGVLLIFNDLLAVYVIPAIKVLILIVLFFLSIFMLISAVLKLELNIINNFTRSLLTPLLVFTGTCVALSFITSLFMSNGADYITEGKTTMSLGDPTMTIIIMIVLNGLYVAINAKLLIKCWKSMVDYMKAVGFAAVGAMTGAFKTIGGAIVSAPSRLRRSSNKLNKSIKGLNKTMQGDDEGGLGSGGGGGHSRHGISPFASGFLGGLLGHKLANHSDGDEADNKQKPTSWYDKLANAAGNGKEKVKERYSGAKKQDRRDNKMEKISEKQVNLSNEMSRKRAALSAMKSDAKFYKNNGIKPKFAQKVGMSVAQIKLRTSLAKDSVQSAVNNKRANALVAMNQDNSSNMFSHGMKKAGTFTRTKVSAVGTGVKNKVKGIGQGISNSAPVKTVRTKAKRASNDFKFGASYATKDFRTKAMQDRVIAQANDKSWDVYSAYAKNQAYKPN